MNPKKNLLVGCASAWKIGLGCSAYNRSEVVELNFSAARAHNV